MMIHFVFVVLKSFALLSNFFACQAILYSSDSRSTDSPRASAESDETQQQSPLMAIIESLRCDLREQSTSNSTSQYFFEEFDQGTAPIIVNFRRQTTWDSDHLFELVPLGMNVEDTRIDVPPLGLQRVLGDMQSVKERLLQTVWDSLKNQAGNIMIDNLSHANVRALRKQATAGLRGSTLLEDRARDLQFAPDDTLTDDEIVQKHIGESKSSRHYQGLRTADSLASFDRRLWRLLCDWDANHVDDAVEGAAVGMAAGAALAIVAPPVGAVAGIVAAIGGGVVGGTSAGHHRRCLALAIHNRTAKRIAITNLVKQEATNLIKTTNEVMEPYTGGDWDSRTSTVIFAAASSPVLRAAFETGMLELVIDCDCLRIRATNDFVRVYSKDPTLCYNIVSMDVHHWWSRWVLVLSDAKINLLQAPTPSVKAQAHAEKASEPPDPQPQPHVSSVATSSLPGNSSVRLTFDGAAEGASGGGEAAVPELEPEPEAGPDAAATATAVADVDLGLPSVPGTSTASAGGSVNPDAQALHDMGFTAEQARLSLAASGGDVQRAIDHALLAGGDDEISAGGDGPAAAAVVPVAAAAATISPWLPVGASDQGIKGEKCGPEYATEAAVQQAFKPGTHIGYYLANGAPAQY